MKQNIELPELEGYVSIQKAADLLGLAPSTVHGHVKTGRLAAFQAGSGIAIPLEEIENYKHNPPGRTRIKAPDWRKFNPRSGVLATEIHVKVFPGQLERFLEILQTIRDKKLHTFKGSIARYVLKDRHDNHLVRIVLIWKDTEMPDAEEHEREIKAFQDELADVLDWETARFEDGEGLIYT